MSSGTYQIPDAEFKARIATLQARLKAEKLDAALAHGYECDCAYVRYLSDFWPTFEIAGVFVPAEGDPVLLVGPESENYGRRRGRIAKVVRMGIYAESAEPSFPGVTFATFGDVVKLAMGDRPLRRLGILGWAVMNLPVYLRLQEQLPGTQIVKACHLLVEQRQIKSANELRCLERAFAISELAVDAILAEGKPGMTELQLVGIAQRELYKHGAEYEGHALYSFGGENTCSGISRPSQRLLNRNELIQLNIGARVAGYASSVGLPFSFGPLPAEQKRVLEFGLAAHHKTIELLRGGRVAGEVVREYEQFVRDQGFGEYLLYGPCHSIGLMEVEQPWMESNSTYQLQPNMTFQVDTYLHGKNFGLRWENGVVITATGARTLSSKHMKVVEL
jgi:Xaa-Pro aminopeptidase